ncbi:MAG: hypothetical protein PHR06_11075 [Candidatus Cloacimonetes bacterium]|nr:hypothetical protein [Candidatus Cloacimonadota bacterium]
MAKSKYDPELFPLLVEDMARQGLNEKDIAFNLGVSVATFEVYKNKYPEFLEALKEGKKPVNIRAENALLKRALGYETVEESVKEVRDGNGNLTGHVFRRTMKHIPPDTGAVIYLLCNRLPQKWSRNPDNRISRETETIDFEFEVIDGN